jgi:hypothetical protein
MYLKLNEIQPKTEEWIKASWKKGRWSPNAVINSDGDIIDARLKMGLQPTPLTRDLKWGVPIPIVGEDVNQMAGKVLCKGVAFSFAALPLIAWHRCLVRCSHRIPQHHLYLYA